MTTGELSGVVKDATAAVVPDADLVLKSLDTGESRTGKSSSSGSYRFSFLKPGKYQVSASVPGLKSDAQAVDVGLGQSVSLDLVVKVGQATQVVEVSDAATLLNTENANVASTVSAKQVQDLPIAGGDLTTIAFTVPGISMNTGVGYGNFSSQGLQGTSNLFTINGTDYNDPYLNLNNSGASNLLLGQNDVEEASVVQNGYSVQYGRQAGAQVNYVTKSGTNDYHGTLLYNFNGSVLNANDFFANAAGIPRPQARSNEWADSIGGPVLPKLKNKLFFFVDNEGLYYTLPATGVVTIPSPQLQAYTLQHINAAQLPLYQKAFSVWNSAPGAKAAVPITNGTGLLQDGTGNLGCAGLAGTPTGAGGTFGVDTPCGDAYGTAGSNQNREWLLTSRVDWNITSTQRFYARFKADHGFQPTGTNLVNPGLNLQSIQPEYEGQINHTWTISPTSVNNFSASVLWYSAIFGPASVSASSNIFPTYFAINGGGANGGGFYPMGVNWASFPQGRNAGQGQLSDDYSIVKGNNTFKAGVNYRRNRVTDFTYQQGAIGSYTFNSLADFATGVTDPATGSNYFQRFAPYSDVHIRFYNIGLYFQDEWAVAPNLKITAGIRFDRTADPTCLDKCFSLLNGPFANIQQGASIPYNASIQTGLSHAYYKVDPVVYDPRVGVVWSPKGSNGTTLRGGFGIFSDLAPGVLVSSVFTNAPYPYSAVVLNGSEVGPASDPNSAAAAASNQFNAFKSGFLNGATLAQLNNAVPGGFSPIPYFSIPSRFATPEVMKWSFEVQQPIGSKTVLDVLYSGNHGYNLLVNNGFANAYASPANFPNGFGGLPATAPDPRFTSVTQLTNSGVSNYDGLIIQARRALAHGLQGQISYVWSHALDNISNVAGEAYSFCSGCSLTSQVSPNVHDNYGNSDFDIRHQLVADFIYDTPWKFSNKLLNTVAGGWTLSGKFFARTGTPFSILDYYLPADLASSNINATMLASFSGAGGQLTNNCGRGAVNSPCFNTSQFLASGAEANFGNVGRNTFRGPGYFDIDSALSKTITVKERYNFKLGVEAFNMMNHAHFNNPNAYISFGGFGQITSSSIQPTSAYGAFQGSAVSGRVLVINGRFTF